MWKSSCDGSKKELREILKEQIGSIQRVSAMIVFDQEKTMADLGLGQNGFTTFPPSPVITRRLSFTDCYKDTST